MASKARGKRRPNRRDPTGINATQVEEAIKGVEKIADEEEKRIASEINNSITNKFKNEKFNTEAAQSTQKPIRTSRFQPSRFQPTPKITETKEIPVPVTRRYESYDTSSREVADHVTRKELAASDLNENQLPSEEDFESETDDDVIEQLQMEIEQLKLQLQQKDLEIKAKDMEISRLKRTGRRRPKESDL